MFSPLFKVLKDFHWSIPQICDVFESITLKKFGYFQYQYAHADHLYHARSVLSHSYLRNKSNETPGIRSDKYCKQKNKQQKFISDNNKKNIKNYKV